jgi:hypothetical protein
MFPIEKLGRAVLVLCAGATALLGCPLYDDDCDDASDCASGFYCDRNGDRCLPVLAGFGCIRPSECEVGETCTRDFVCRPGSCDYHGCVSGYRCSVVDSAHTCVADDAAPDASVPADASIEDASVPPDASAGADAGNSAADASP